ncbi:hypothetical protein [Endozoicomonas sp. 4G]|uniref:hypothetical protein n=1 Tax=Endozoicomonas sp. 4G TaxID=2872754 RepID=UPI002078F5D8|nr:hypothetical protein [Endozoicomonas sp. 4G]
MNTSSKLIGLFPCLLFICSLAHSGVSREEQFHLLSHYNNASLVEDGLKLATSSSGLAASTAINYGLWYGICKAPGVVAALTGHFALSGKEQNELQEVKSSFCNELAAVLTSAEIALAGHVSPWPLQTPWWQPLRFIGTAYSAYAAYNTGREPYHLIPIFTAGYFINEVVTRTSAASGVIWFFRYQDNNPIQPLNYPSIEYSILSAMTGMVVGTIVHEMMINRDVSSAKAAFAYVISCALVVGMSAISPLSIHNSGNVGPVRTEAGAEDLAGAGALAGSFALALSGGASIGFTSSSIITWVGGLATIVMPQIYARQAFAYVGAPAVIGLAIGVYAMHALGKQRSKLDSNHGLRNIALTLAPALALAVINGVSNNAVYGYSLEESFTETAWTQWKKFYAPLDYLRTLFN